MRYLAIGKTARFFAKALRRKQLNVDEMSDYMLRDIGFIDGRPTLCAGGFAEADARSRGFDGLAITPYAS